MLRLQVHNCLFDRRQFRRDCGLRDANNIGTNVIKVLPRVHVRHDVRKHGLSGLRRWRYTVGVWIRSIMIFGVESAQAL